MTESTATVATCLRVHGPLTGDEIDALERHWTPLDTRLRGFDPNNVVLDLYIKDRDAPGQHLTLEAKIAGWPPLVATTSEQDLDHALNVVRDEMVRLVSHAKDTHRPRRTRSGRDRG